MGLNKTERRYEYRLYKELQGNPKNTQQVSKCGEHRMASGAKPPIPNLLDQERYFLHRNRQIRRNARNDVETLSTQELKVSASAAGLLPAHCKIDLGDSLGGIANLIATSLYVMFAMRPSLPVPFLSTSISARRSSWHTSFAYVQRKAQLGVWAISLVLCSLRNELAFKTAAEHVERTAVKTGDGNQQC